MSDLAPFVAAVLRDQTVSDLIRELTEQKERVAKSQEIEIRAGERVCFKGKMNQGRYKGEHGGLWMVSLEQVADVPLAEIESLEILLGGVVVVSSSHQTRCHPTRPHGDYYISIDGHRSVQYFSIRVSPFVPFPLYRHFGEGHGIPCERLAQGGREHPQMNVYVRDIYFRLREVQGLLDNLGVPQPAASELAADDPNANDDGSEDDAEE